VDESKGPLADVTVIDLSHALAGPFASTMLADFGAEVVKVESPHGGDIARAWGPPFYEPQIPQNADGMRKTSEAAYFVTIHRNKKSVVINLKHPQGRELCLSLMKSADVVLENLRVGEVARLGVDYTAARAQNESIVYCSISGYGQTGPYSNRPAFDLVTQAECGMISITGPTGGPGVRVGISIADITAGMFAAFGIVTALHHRRRTGEGQYIDVSMFEGQLNIMQGLFGAYFASGSVPKPLGTAYTAIVPYQTFRTKTRDLALAVGSERLWRRFCRAIRHESLLHDPRYATNAERVMNRGSLTELLQVVFLERSYEQWERTLVPAGIPMGAANTIDNVVRHPQVHARNAICSSNHAVVKCPGFIGGRLV
jgi:crotonobetainyl-CoA:carnitine CoA-transferase CaiB-like acyl-CoA transferase